MSGYPLAGSGLVTMRSQPPHQPMQLPQMQPPMPRSKGSEQQRDQLPTQAKANGLPASGPACSKQVASTWRPSPRSLKAAAAGTVTSQQLAAKQQNSAEKSAKAALAQSQIPAWASNPEAWTAQQQALQRPKPAAICAEASMPDMATEEPILPRPHSNPLPSTPAPPPEEYQG